MSKLDRLELAETRKIRIFITGVVIVYMLLSVICAAVSNGASTDTALTFKIILLLISALGTVVAGVIMIKRFYNILFTGDGLVKFAYPVENNAHLNTNLRCGLMWIFSILTIIIAGLWMSDVITQDRVEDFGAGNLFGDLRESFQSNYLSNPDLKAVIAVIILVIALIVVTVNFYMSFIFTLTMAGRICGKYNILQKNGVIFIAGIVMYYIHMIVVAAMSWIENAYSEYWMYQGGYNLFERDWIFVEEIDRPLANILVYGVTAFIMYRISKTILDKKLDI